MKLKANANTSMFPKFEKIGDTVTGTFVEFNEDVPSKFGNENNLVLKGERGPLMIRCGTKLTAIVKDNLPLFVRGCRVKIVYTADIPTGKGNPMKDFDVDIDPPDAETVAQMKAEDSYSDAGEVTPF